MNNVRHISAVTFPTFQPRHVNMMPFIMGDTSSIPEELHGYLPMIEACPLGDEIGKVGYLTVDERFVEEGSQRRGGIHTEGFGNAGWGGGNWGRSRASWGGWGGTGGLFIANSVDNSCALYDTAVEDTPFGGAVRNDQVEGIDPVMMPANNVFWIHDRTPHASLPVQNTPRQFFRLVTSDVSMWFAKHSTPNPLGVQPNARIIHADKFEMMAA